MGWFGDWCVEWVGDAGLSREQLDYSACVEDLSTNRYQPRQYEVQSSIPVMSSIVLRIVMRQNKAK